MQRNSFFKEETKFTLSTGKSVEEISDALERDNFMTAEEAKKFGLITLLWRKENNTQYIAYFTTSTC